MRPRLGIERLRLRDGIGPFRDDKEEPCFRTEFAPIGSARFRLSGPCLDPNVKGFGTCPQGGESPISRDRPKRFPDLFEGVGPDVDPPPFHRNERRHVFGGDRRSCAGAGFRGVRRAGDAARSRSERETTPGGCIRASCRRACSTGRDWCRATSTWMRRRRYLYHIGSGWHRDALMASRSGGRGLYQPGTFRIGRKAEWPSWTPTANMIARGTGGLRTVRRWCSPAGRKIRSGARAFYLYTGGGATPTCASTARRSRGPSAHRRRRDACAWSTPMSSSFMTTVAIGSTAFLYPPG